MVAKNNHAFIVEIDLDTKLIKDINLDEFGIIGSNPKKIYWINVDLSQNDLVKTLQDGLHVSEEVLSLMKMSDKNSQIYESDGSLTLQFKFLNNDDESTKEELDVKSLCIHLTSSYCLTLSDGPVKIFDDILRDLSNATRYAKTPGVFLFLILNNITNLYSSIYYRIETNAEDMEMNLNNNSFETVVSLKNKALWLKRHTIILQNLFSYISGRNIKVVSKKLYSALLNLSNIVQSIISGLDSVRELLTNTLSQFDNQLAKQMNRTMLMLTKVAAVFLPPTLIAAIYGMNNLPRHGSKLAYGSTTALILIFLSILFMLIYVRRNK